MSVSLREVFGGAGYDLDEIEDIQKVLGMLEEAEDLQEELEDRLDDLENRDPEREAEEARAEYELGLLREEE